jgi:hypothetical protein
MPEFSWRRRPTKYFGDVWVPYAEIELLGSSGQFHSFAVQVDSGAVVSLLRRSVAELLGIRLESGRKIDLTSVGGAQTFAYIHEIKTRFEADDEFPAPFAFAEVETVPNLLGRHGFFDRMQVDFDATLEQTRLSAPWLSPEDARIWRFMLETDKFILDHERWNANPLPGRADEAAAILQTRGAQVFAAIGGLIKLHRGYEAPLLVRALLELSMQLSYLLQDPELRAEQYLDFAHVSKYEQIQAIIKQPTGFISRKLAYSPNRLSGEARLKREYDRVKNKFMRKSSRTWDNWYCMKVRDLAVKLGRLPEYNLWYKMCSAWGHGDPFESSVGLSIKPLQLYQIALGFYGGMLLTIAEAKKILLSSERYQTLSLLSKGIF